MAYVCLLQLFSLEDRQVEMSVFAKILSEFSKIKLTQKTQFTQYQANRAMDQLTQLNANYSQFDRQVAEQLWEHTTKNPEGRALLKDYIQTIIDARNILKENIDKCSKQLTFEQDPTKREDLQQCLLSYGQDYRILGEPLLLQQLPSHNASMSQSIQQSRQSRGGKSQQSSQIFTDTASSRQESTSLKVVLIVVLVLFPSQILCMFVRNHFLNFLVYLAVLSIFALNYFDRIYIRFCEIALGLSVVLDLLWTITHSGDYWNPAKETQYSHLQPGFLKFVYILTIIGLGAKILIMIILFRFTKNTENTNKFVRFLNRKIQLNGRAQDNPLSALFTLKSSS